MCDFLLFSCNQTSQHRAREGRIHPAEMLPALSSTKATADLSLPPSLTPCFTSPTHTAEFCKCRVAEHLICHGELCVAQSWDSPGALQELQNTPASECAHSSCFGSPKEPASKAAGSAHAEGWLTLHGCKGHVCFCLCIASCPATCRDCATKSARGSAQAG